MATNKKFQWKASEGKMGKNIAYTVDEKGILTLRIDLNLDLGPSASGKTRIIGSSEGNQKIDGGNGAIVGLNLYRKPE